MLSLLGAGQGQNNSIQSIINAFKARVASDNGIFEAESCLSTILTNLNNI